MKGKSTQMVIAVAVVRRNDGATGRGAVDEFKRTEREEA